MIDQDGERQMDVTLQDPASRSKSKQTRFAVDDTPTAAQRTQTSNAKDALLFFLCGIGASLPYISTLSALVYFSSVYGPKSFIYLNLAVYAPLVPVSLAQARWDQDFDKDLGSYRTFKFRGCVGFVASTSVLACVPFTKTMSTLAFLAVVLGSSGAVVQGMLTQLAAFVSAAQTCSGVRSSSNLQLKAAVQAGFQASALVALCLSIVTDFGSSSKEHGFRPFFFSVAALVLILFVLFLELIRSSRLVRLSIMHRDSSLSNLGEMLLEGGDVSDEINEDTLELKYRQLWKSTSLCCATLVITLVPSFLVGSWFTHVRTDYTALPQILFYTRIGSDFLGRIVIVALPPTSVKCLFILASLRLLVTVLFFVNASTDWFRNRDELSVTLVAIIAFASGYLVTGCFQLAPTLLADESRGANVTKQASLLNVAFSLSGLVGILSSFVLLGLGLG